MVYRTHIKFRGINFSVLIQIEFREGLISWGFYFVANPSLDFRVLSSARQLCCIYRHYVSLYNLLYCEQSKLFKLQIYEN